MELFQGKYTVLQMIPNIAGEKRLILCVEDDPCIRSDITEELGEAGYLVAEAEDGVAALKVLEQRKPDLILCDISMPIMGGFDLLHTIRENHPSLDDVPFMFLSVMGDRENIIQGKNFGADDYLVKPVDFDIMLAAINTRLTQVSRMKRAMAPDAAELIQSPILTAIEDTREAFASIANTLDGMESGVIFLDSIGHVQVMNRTATQIIKAEDGLLSTPTGLRTTSAKSTRALRLAISDALEASPKGSTISVAREAQRPLVVQICPLGARETPGLPTVAVLVIDPANRPRLMPQIAARMYDLTPSEARLASALVDGKRLEEIADEFDVAPTTISFHLQNLFRKTQTTRQTDLVALLLRGALTLRSEAA
ncbi:response regulator [Microvirga sp. CF3062]|uniref:response regulator n=1 Tax=Microvirga sp. CF3062 TaxID=3110182 RepID=UPI002E7610B3|nr:response regulator [Microvirga sp. CF3062]MEE1656929.1 response regulator [Microvirga sp. CF3062]